MAASPLTTSGPSTQARLEADFDSDDSFSAEQAEALVAAQQAFVAAHKAREAAARAAEAHAAADRAEREAKEAERAEAFLRERTAAAAAAAFPSLEELRKKLQAEPHSGDARRRLQQALAAPPRSLAQQRPAIPSTSSAAGADSAVPEWRRRFEVRPPPVHVPAAAPARPAWGGAAGHGTAGAGAAAAAGEDSRVNGAAICDGGVGKTDLRRIQAQQEGSEQARRALLTLTGLGFPTKRAAAALLNAGGDVTKAEAALRAEVADAKSLQQMVSGSFGVRSVAATPVEAQTVGSRAWGSPGKGGGGGARGGGGGKGSSAEGGSVARTSPATTPNGGAAWGLGGGGEGCSGDGGSASWEGGEGTNGSGSWACPGSKATPATSATPANGGSGAWGGGGGRACSATGSTAVWGGGAGTGSVANGGGGVWGGGCGRGGTDESKNSGPAGGWRTSGGGYFDSYNSWGGSEEFPRPGQPWAPREATVEPVPQPVVKPTRLLLRKPGEKPPGVLPRANLLPPNPQWQLVGPRDTAGRAAGAAAGAAAGESAATNVGGGGAAAGMAGGGAAPNIPIAGGGNGPGSTLDAQQRGGASSLLDGGVHAAGSGAAGGSGLSLKQKLEQVLIYLGMDVTLPMATAVKRANEAMGISPEGPLPAQVDRLLAAARRAQGGGHVGT